MVRRLNEQASGSTKIDMNVKVNILHIHFKSIGSAKAHDEILQYEFTAPSTTPATSSNANQIYFDQVDNLPINIAALL